MARSPTDRLDALLHALGPRIRRGGAPPERRPHLSTGIPTADGLLGGGFPRGQLAEIAGPLSSGRTSLALALLARTTAAGELAAVVDGADAFDPASAGAAGAALDRVLWVRAPRLRSALRSAERLLEVRGFALVLLDLAQPDLRPAPAAWLRLARGAAGTGTALVVLSPARWAGSAAALAVEMAPARVRFGGSPALLEELESEAVLVRCRSAPGDRTALLRLRPRAA